jgi:DNA-directed RNA polymerase I subunit RPA49
MATELGRLFGSKRAKRAIADQERNIIALPGTNPDGSAKLDRAAAETLDVIGEAGASMATREELQATVDATKPVPKANLDAEDIQDVYDPIVLIGADVLNSVSVKVWQDAVKGGEGVEVSSKYVASRINRIAQGPNSTSRLRLLRYTYFLISYYASSTRKRGGRQALRRKEFQELADAPSGVAMHIQDKFSSRGDINSYYDALLLTHIFAFASILDNFELEIEYLREDLKIDQEKFAQHFHEIGGRVVQAKDLGTGRLVRVARLALPLQFPRIRKIRQARR